MSHAPSPIDQLVECITCLPFKPFVPTIASAVYFYVKGVPSFEENDNDPVAIEVELDIGGKFRSKEFKDLLASFRHMKELLGMRSNLNMEEFFSESDAVCIDTGSLRYHEMVKFVVESDEFWRSGRRFVQMLEPLLRVLAVYGGVGMTIGHWYRCLEYAKAAYEDNFFALEQDLSDFNELWNAASNTLSKAAAALDPLYLDSRCFIYDDSLKCLLEFAGQFVLDEDRVAFEREVEEYLDKNPKFFHCSVEYNKNIYHPVVVWNWNGFGLPILRKYAVKLVLIEYSSVLMTDVDVKRLFSSKEDMDVEEINKFAHEVYKECNAQVLDTFVRQEGTSFGGYMEFWEKMKDVDNDCWDLIATSQYDLFCRQMECFLK